MDEFEKYLEQLATHQEAKSRAWKNDARHRILVHGGVLLNWLGDFLASDNIKWEKTMLPIEQIQMTGTTPEWNEVFVGQCERDPVKLSQLIGRDAQLGNKVRTWARTSENGELPILVRKDTGKYKVLDGMHRFVGLVVDGATEVEVYRPTNESIVLPVCEPHVVYDLIRGYIRHAKDELGKKELYHALNLLGRIYSNVKPLLKERFGKKWIFDEDTQEIIGRVVDTNG